MKRSDDMTFPKWSAQAAVRALLHFGVKDAVVSPGTRDMPLILALDAEERLRKHIVIDERSATFAALGMAAASCLPVALVCTSGSALLNYAPALAEAYYRQIPLIVLSADRPERWIDQADSQTIRQPGALAAVVRKSVVIPDFGPGDSEALKLASLRIFDALASAVRAPCAPVHLNFPFSLPLGPEHPLLPPIRFPEILSPRYGMTDAAETGALAPRLIGKKVLVVCGQMAPDKLANDVFDRLAWEQSIAVIAENLSNLHSDRIPRNIDAMLSDFTEAESLRPDLIMVCGGALVSARLKSYLRSLDSVPLWYIAPYADMVKDTFDNLSLYVDSEPAIFFDNLLSAIDRLKESNRPDAQEYNNAWSRLSLAEAGEFERYASRAPWSELKAMHHILASIPAHYNLHLSNGTAIRYSLLSNASFHTVSCNRGVSGIEGSTSTALGAAIAHTAPTLLITGDMSFAYDIGALAMKEIPRNFKIIVLSNAGGGIFRFIPKTSALPQREEYFCVDPVLPLPQLALAYGFRYLEANSPKALSDSMRKLINTDNEPVILNIIVDPEVSAATFRNYFKP